MTGSQRIDNILAIVGALVPILSALASFVNHLIRQKSDAGEQVSPVMLHAGAFLNVASVNMDKAVQLTKMARGQSVPVTTLPAPAPVPAPQNPPQPPPSTYVA